MWPFSKLKKLEAELRNVRRDLDELRAEFDEYVMNEALEKSKPVTVTLGEAGYREIVDVVKRAQKLRQI